MSAVTDPSESPMIFTYEKDYDSVSQITSSLAGNSFEPPRLQNIPTNLDKYRFRTIGSKGLSWMDNGSAPIIRPEGRRKIHQKGGAFVPGPCGRRRGLCPPKSTSSPPGGSVGNGSGRGGSGVPSCDGRGGPDEIAYARNADGRGSPTVAGRKLRRRPAPVVVAREGPGPPGNGEDPSDVGSGGASCIDACVDSAVSRLGMGGVSCGAQSVLETAAASESTSLSAQDLFQRLVVLAWTVQHHARWFFFPTSPEVAQLKKFDRSNLLDELDMLLEEGSGSLSHRKPLRSVRDGDDENNNEEEIDYFSRVMSESKNLHGWLVPLRMSPKDRKRRSWIGGVAIVGVLIFAINITFSYYTIIQEESPEVLKYETRDRNQGVDLQEEPSQVFEYRDDQNDVLVSRAGEELVVADDVYPLKDQEEIVHAVQLGGPVDNTAQESRNQILDASDAKVVNGDDPYGEAEVAGADWSAADGQHFQANRAVQLPSKFEVLANVDDIPFQRGIDMPFYWHVPRSGGGTMNDVLGRSCLHLTLAADVGVGMNGEILKVLNFPHQVSYVNVDTSTHQGISRAKKLNLASSGLADVVISPLLHEASSLFTSTRRGRLFTLFRHPVERAASLFYFIQETQWQQPGTRNDQFANITIEQFYKKGFAENNWVTRFLTNELTKGELTEKDLRIAKEVLRQKCLVGLLEKPGESFERIQRFFGWRVENDCFEKKMEREWPMKHKHPTIKEGTEAWRLIVAENKFDMRLYEYARDLFLQQGQQLFSQ